VNLWLFIRCSQWRCRECPPSPMTIQMHPYHTYHTLYPIEIDMLRLNTTHYIAKDKTPLPNCQSNAVASCVGFACIHQLYHIVCHASSRDRYGQNSLNAKHCRQEDRAPLPPDLLKDEAKPAIATPLYVLMMSTIRHIFKQLMHCVTALLPLFVTKHPTSCISHCVR
jgi:hypothetical protein